MRFLADMGISLCTVEWLRQQGDEVILSQLLQVLETGATTARQSAAAALITLILRQNPTAAVESQAFTMTAVKFISRSLAI
ncbi:MAG: hypothetical protein KME20_25070 [Kaiparowitsia implicata GSE-PSE-MK54-09C]|jgi:hypothetical protein|nr:hypothetical protein [Kaiparowitsia implicata GSE-PSE-MK54-09C]